MLGQGGTILNETRFLRFKIGNSVVILVCDVNNHLLVSLRKSCMKSSSFCSRVQFQYFIILYMMCLGTDLNTVQFRI